MGRRKFENPAELPITGYTDRFSGKPGKTISLHVSLRHPGTYDVELVRVKSADPNPTGPGVVIQPLPEYLHRSLAGHRYPIRRGSFGKALAPNTADCAVVTWTALILLPKEQPHAMAIMSHRSGNNFIILGINGRSIEVEIGGRGTHRYLFETDVRPNRWYRVWLTVDRQHSRTEVGAVPLDSDTSAIVREIEPKEISIPNGGEVLIGATMGPTTDSTMGAEGWHCFDGRIEDPAILSGEIEFNSVPLPSLNKMPRLLAGWDLSVGIDTHKIFDIGPSGLHGVLVNQPMRAVKGARWTGSRMRWQDAPEEYGAIHFHSDDLSDCEWPAAIEYPIPNDLTSGCYAFHLFCADGEDFVPFFVLPQKSSTVSLAFIVPTFTYQIYANVPRIAYDKDFASRDVQWKGYPYGPEDYPIYGSSAYHSHPDGSGISFSSRLRPILNMRPGFLTQFDRSGSGVHHYVADLHLLAWLDAKGIACDIVTDEDLHETGVDLISKYSGVLTGTHPEYQTLQTLDAIESYLRGGGSIAYLGGNGFYWRVGRNDAVPHVLEIRRAEGGTRSWASQPGEYYHATDGAYGGTWRANGRYPQALVGVGFAANGDFTGVPYRRTRESYDPEVSWIFKGVEGEIIGDYGLSGGGAAGYEVDRMDVSYGTPYNTIVIARSEALPAAYFNTMEEVLFPGYSITGAPLADLRRADMVFSRTPYGGSIFSVGSVTFCGSLWKNGAPESGVSRILENVLADFAGSNKPLKTS